MKANKLPKSKMKISTYVICVALLLLLSMFAGSLSFTQSPSINPTSPNTNNNLTCTWAAADTTQVNVSWYKNGALFNTTTTTNNYSIIPPENTTKNEVWICNVTITNGTDTTSSYATTTIINSAPYEPNVYNASGQSIGVFQVLYEDQIYYYDINATDPDNDTLTYRRSPTASFCTVTNENTGAVTCAPNSSHLGHVGYNETMGQMNITFWADDPDTINPLASGHVVLFNITPVNDAPSFNPSLTNQSVNETQIFNYALNGTDEENNIPFNFSISISPALDLRINITSNTSAVIMYGNNETLPSTSANNYTVNITISDNQGANSVSGFILRVKDTNMNPVLDFIPNQTGSQGQPFLLYVNATDPDVSDTLNFTLSLSQSCAISNPWTIITLNNSSQNGTAMINVSNLTNNHVVCRNVRITVFDIGDAGAEDYQDVFLNISNTNDPPNVEVLSSHSNNTGGNNISNLVAYAESTFVYWVNATDPDTLTYEGEVLTFSDDTGLFNINSSTGLIRFTPAQGDVGDYAITITVSDDGSPNSGPHLSDAETMNLEIINNSAPVLAPIGDLSCAEHDLCFILINATDNDGDNLTFTSNYTTIFNLTSNASQNPRMSAYVNYTPDQDFVGTHSIVVTVTDPRGAYDTEAILFTINNTNDAPVLQSFSFPSIIAETHPVSFYIRADDSDYSLPSSYANIDVNGTYLTEYVTFNVTNLSGKKLFNLTTFLNSSNNKTYTIVSFTPQLDEDRGNYSVNISATDYAGATNWTIRNFTIFPKAEPPNITQIMPYGRPINSSTVFDFISTGYFNGSRITSINFSENRSVIYNVSVNDSITAPENMNYYWLINGNLNSTQHYLNLSYNFFSQGKYNLTVIVENERYENATWIWNVTVDNVNRRPLLINPLRNLTNITGTTQDNDYLKQSGSDVHFIDPDDEIVNDSNNIFDPGEGSSLTYNVTPCSIATITIINNSIKINPSSVGSCIVWFTAIDSGGFTNTSNPVTINITEISNSTIEKEVQRSGGGGSSRNTPIVIPIKQEEDKPKAIELVVPNLVTVYENKTVLIPITVKNTWNSTLKGISLNASSNSSYITLKLTENYFDEMIVGEKKDVTLMVGNYRLGENYEVKITANVTSPVASDSALVMLNTIEQANTGPQVDTKVTFAQDLLRENPECIELNELLEKAKTELSTGSKEEASRMVDAVINGCKYMVSISKKAEQQPQSLANKFINQKNLKYLLMFIGVALLAMVIVFVVKKKKASIAKEAKKEGEPGEKKEEVQPYWPGSSV
jgi:hypothetical protein